MCFRHRLLGVQVFAPYRGIFKPPLEVVVMTYDPKIMKLFVVGGGGCLIRNFGKYDRNRVFINEDICATAKGYEYMAERALRKTGGMF